MTAGFHKLGDASWMLYAFMELVPSLNYVIFPCVQVGCNYSNGCGRRMWHRKWNNGPNVPLWLVGPVILFSVRQSVPGILGTTRVKPILGTLAPKN